MIAAVKKAQSFVATLGSGFVSDDVYEARQKACSVCDELRLVKGIRYCEACECPHVAMYALRWKNTKAGWKCPLGNHKE